MWSLRVCADHACESLRAKTATYAEPHIARRRTAAASLRALASLSHRSPARPMPKRAKALQREAALSPPSADDRNATGASARPSGRLVDGSWLGPSRGRGNAAKIIETRSSSLRAPTPRKLSSLKPSTGRLSFSVTEHGRRRYLLRFFCQKDTDAFRYVELDALIARAGLDRDDVYDAARRDDDDPATAPYLAAERTSYSLVLAVLVAAKKYRRRSVGSARTGTSSRASPLPKPAPLSSRARSSSAPRRAATNGGGAVASRRGEPSGASASWVAATPG